MELKPSSVTYYGMSFVSSEDNKLAELSREQLERTVILVDWDDTVLASSVLRMHGVRGNHLKIPPSLQKGLEVLERTVCKFFSAAVQHGNTVIVTNSEPGWVELSSEKFMPRLNALLKRLQVKVIYAKEAHGSSRGTPTDWKAKAFRDQVEALYPSTDEVNVLALGDGTVERDAANKLAQEMPKAFVKAVKLSESPTLATLTSQLSVLLRRFEDIMKADRCTEIRIIS